MTRRNFMAALLATLAVSTVAAAPAPGVFTVRVKMISAGKVTLVPVGEVTRVGNKVTLRALAAPSIDQLSDRFVAAWKAYARPARVTITESIASDTGMRPAHKDYSFTFTPKDPLYMAAVIKEFVGGLKYEALGMTSIHFIERDMTKEYPPGANDRAAQIINIRKGTTLDTSGGFESFFIKAPVRPSGNGTDG